MNWVKSYEEGVQYLESLDGVLWADARLPRRWHRCRAQTRGFMGTGRFPPDFIQRCACGATCFPRFGKIWTNKNERRH